jgi:DHA2 family multidrug resistance protein
VAFVAIFMAASGPHLPFAGTIHAFVLLFPGTTGAAISGLAEDSLGWRTLFPIQAVIDA